MDLYRAHVLVCGGTGCTASDSEGIIEAFNTELENLGLDKEVLVVRTGCFGLCEAGPIAIVYPEGAFYSRLKVEDVAVIAQEHLLKGRIVKDLLYKGAFDKDTIRSLNNVDFYKKQKRIALKKI